VNDMIRAQKAVENYIAFFNSLDRLSLSRLTAVAAPNICFIDPFNKASGYDSVMAVLTHFIDNVQTPHFDVKSIAFSGNKCFVSWDFSGVLTASGKAWRFTGVSELTLDGSYRIMHHQDYWDAATHFYEKLPVIGYILRLIKRKISILK